MLVSLTVGKVDAGVTVLLTPDKRLIEFPSILLPPNISSGSIVDINVSQNATKEAAADRQFRTLQDEIYESFGAREPSTPVLRCLNATQTSVVLEWDPIELATADLISLTVYRNDQKAGNIVRPLTTHNTKVTGLGLDTEYRFHLVLRTTAGTFTSDEISVVTHKMTNLSGVTITTGILPPSVREHLVKAVERIGAKIIDSVRIDTTHFITTEGRGQQWEEAVENNIPVVRPEWVDACENAGRILGVTKFYLDAMKPRAPIEERPQTRQAAPPAEKDLPAAPSQPTEGPAKSEEKKEEETKKKESSESKPEDASQPEQKARATPKQEQKVRFEDVKEQKVALRLANAGEQSNDNKADEAKKSEEEEGEASAKPAATPDGASFQEVEL